MLWETTVRFQVLPTGVTAAVLIVFVVLGSALAWARNLTAVAFVNTAAAAVTALAGRAGPSFLATAHTLVICAVALALGFSGSRWRRAELVWIAYGAIALSLVCYGAALIAIPRLVRSGAWRG
jgi:hypothetical protein